ncbi:hypothetical protein V8E51_014275 [Hyaloscypha variabilis]
MSHEDSVKVKFLFRYGNYKSSTDAFGRIFKYEVQAPASLCSPRSNIGKQPDMIVIRSWIHRVVERYYNSIFVKHCPLSEMRCIVCSEPATMFTSSAHPALRPNDCDNIDEPCVFVLFVPVCCEMGEPCNRAARNRMEEWKKGMSSIFQWILKETAEESCGWCGNSPAGQMCGGCLAILYCSKDCQIAHLPLHHGTGHCVQQDSHPRWFRRPGVNYP